MLKTFDIVSDPGAPSAFMNGIMEGVEYEMMENGIIGQKIDQIKETVHKTPLKNINEEMLRGFNELVALVKA